MIKSGLESECYKDVFTISSATIKSAWWLDGVQMDKSEECVKTVFASI